MNSSGERVGRDWFDQHDESLAEAIKDGKRLKAIFDSVDLELRLGLIAEKVHDRPPKKCSKSRKEAFAASHFKDLLPALQDQLTRSDLLWEWYKSRLNEAFGAGNDESVPIFWNRSVTLAPGWPSWRSALFCRLAALLIRQDAPTDLTVALDRVISGLGSKHLNSSFAARWDSWYLPASMKYRIDILPAMARGLAIDLEESLSQATQMARALNDHQEESTSETEVNARSMAFLAVSARIYHRLCHLRDQTVDEIKRLQVSAEEAGWAKADSVSKDLGIGSNGVFDENIARYIEDLSKWIEQQSLPEAEVFSIEKIGQILLALREYFGRNDEQELLAEIEGLPLDNLPEIEVLPSSLPLNTAVFQTISTGSIPEETEELLNASFSGKFMDALKSADDAEQFGGLKELLSGLPHSFLDYEFRPHAAAVSPIEAEGNLPCKFEEAPSEAVGNLLERKSDSAGPSLGPSLKHAEHQGLPSKQGNEGTSPTPSKEPAEGREELPRPGHDSVRPSVPTVEPPAEEVQPDASGLPASTSSGDIATGLLRDPEKATATDIKDLLFILAGEGNIGLAYHLARAASASVDEASLGIVQELLLCTVASRFLRGHSGEAASVISQSLRRLQTFDASADSPGLSASLKALWFAALWRPALLAQSTGAAGWLAQLHLGGDPIPSLHDISECILKYTQSGFQVSLPLLRGVRDKTRWEHEVMALCQEAGAWREEKVALGLKYGPANKVWQHWVKPGHPLGDALLAVANNNRKELHKAKETADEWCDTKNVQHQIDATDAEFRSTGRPRIESMARKKLEALAVEVTDYVYRWESLLGAEPQSQGDYLSTHAASLRTDLLAAVQAGEGDLEAFHECLASSQDAATAGILQASLKEIRQLLDPASSTSSPRLALEKALGADLVRSTLISLNDDWLPVAPEGRELVTAILELIVADKLPWSEVFELQKNLQNHDSTSRVIELVEASGDESFADQLREDQRNHIEECRTALKAKKGQVLVEIGEAVTRGLLNEETRNRLQGVVEPVAPDLVLNFKDVRRHLDSVLTQLLQIEAERGAVLSARIDEIELESVDPARFERIQDAIRKRNFLAATEYLDNPEVAEWSIQQLESTDLSRFFPQFVKACADIDPHRLKPPEIIRRVGKGQVAGPIDPGGVPEAQLQSAVQMLRSWYSLKNRPAEPSEDLSNLSESLGLGTAEVQISGRTKSYMIGTLDVNPIADRQICPIPAFGSSASGHYDLLVAWDRPPEEEILQQVGSHKKQSPVLVLYMDHLSEARRRDLARLSLKRQGAMVVIDESLLWFVCQERGARLPVLLRCSLPFTPVNPYTVAAGIVPQEMFYGREQESESIFAPLGTNLVFGGRQLGKTALLRSVERENHRPSSGVVVRWLDLKVAGLGTSKPAGDIWGLIAKVLHQERVVGQPSVTRETLEDRVQTWLAKDKARRIVLLLDESDRFLEADAKTAYENVDGLKGLMDKTDRRFKIVFAGLHDVQRTSKSVNSPLAHFVDPVCIGPLLDNGESREALALIVLPMAALGFQFESRDLPTRILSYTNYYPSLIQLFCKHLLDHLLRPSDSNLPDRSGPPYIVTSAHIEDAYKSAELRRAIKDRFIWTLNLDFRYKVIALRLAIAALEGDTAKVLGSGNSLGWIQREVTSLWGEEIRHGASIEDLRVVVEEMIGLGVLRKTGSNSYTLRSSNILTMLGTEDEILAELVAAVKEPPSTYEPSSFRRASSKGQWARSPLTAQQESELLNEPSGVGIVFGASASGLPDVRDSLIDAFSDHHLQVVEEASDLSSFAEVLRSQIEARREGLNIAIIPPSLPWSGEWVLQGHRLLSSLKSKSSILKLVYLGDTKAAWDWVQAIPSSNPNESRVPIKAVGLRPWSEDAFRRWIEDELPTTIQPDDRDQFRLATGLWAGILEPLLAECCEAPDRWRSIILQPAAQNGFQGTLHRFELIPPAEPILKALAEYGSAMTLEEVLTLTESSSELASHVLAWSELLHYISPVGDSTWRINEFLGKLLIEGKD